MTARTLALLLGSLALVGGCCSNPAPEKRPFAIAAPPGVPVAPPLDGVGGCGGPHEVFDIILDQQPVPAIDARVVQVREGEPTLVLLSVGSDEKVEKGYRFSVYRGSEFVAKVIVEKVLEDSSGCRVLFTKEGWKVQPGDAAATRLQ